MLIDQITALATRQPEVVAVEDADGRRVTYGDLLRAADSVADRLRERGVGVGHLVAVRCARSLAYVIAVLGTARVGAAYVPIDPAYPEARQELMLADARVSAIVDGSELAITLREGGTVDADLAYVVYTSGSTGQPKGVAVGHANLANLVAWHVRAFGTSMLDRVGLCAGVGFDASVWELWTALAAGATIVIPDNETRRDPYRLRDFAVDRRLTAMFAPTALVHVLMDVSWPAATALRWLLTGGEALTRHPARDLPFTLVNNYGPAECTVVATSGVVPAGGFGVPTIGRPIDGVTARIDGSGELLLGGAGVARGYLRRPDLTAERFVTIDGHRWYRTGDLVRQRADGELEYLGRADDQVQVRGYRVEPGEVESAIAAHPGVHSMAVVAGTDNTGATDLTGFYTGPVDPAPLRAWLAGRLPAHLVPAALVRLDALPVTANGKVDRAALRALDRPTRTAGAPPRDGTQARLTAIWAEVLGFPVGVDEDFGALGGHSLHAVRVIGRIEREFGITVPIGHFFGPLTVEELSAMPVFAGDVVEGVALPKAPRGLDAPLTAAQSRYWFIDQFVEDRALYNTGTVFTIDGPLDVPALRAALAGLLARHDALRTAIVATPDGPRQRVTSPSAFPLTVHDLRPAPERPASAWPAARSTPARSPSPLSSPAHPAPALSQTWVDDGCETGPDHSRNRPTFMNNADREAAAPVYSSGDPHNLFVKAAREPFDLTFAGADAAAAAPLIRAVLARTGERQWQLCLIAHHIAIDAASIDVLLRELGGDVSGANDTTFADVAEWEAARPDFPLLADFWRDRLHDAPTLLALPTDRPRPVEPSYRGATLTEALPPHLLDAVDALARRYGATRFMVLLAALSAVLSRHSGQTDIVIGAPVANRPRPEFEGMVGCFVNTIALRTDLSGTPTFAELLDRARRTAIDGFAHQGLPFDRIVDAAGVRRVKAHHPLFTVMLAVQRPEVAEVPFGGATIRYAGELHAGVARFDLTFVVDPATGLTVEYATELFEAATAQRLLRHVVETLALAVAHPETPVDALPPVAAAERSRLLAWGTGRAPLVDVHEPAYREIERRAAAQPEAIAVVLGDREVSYRALNTAANRLAHHLRGLGVGRDVPVGVLLPRSVESVVAMLAVAKAGGAYLPLDAAYPDDRLRAMLADAAPAVVVCADGVRARALTRTSVLSTVDQPDACDGNLPGTPDAADLAYLVYTSGSTGVPKGVLVPHRGLTNLAAAKVAGFDVRPDSRVLQFVSFGFGVSIADVYMTLTAGATLVLRGDAPLDGRDLADLVNRQRVTNLVLPASVLAALPPDCELPTVRAIAVGGEACSAALVNRWAPGRRFVNAYGPSEVTIACAMAVCDAGLEGTPPIGRPIPGDRVYVLDERREPVPVGVPGELYAAGVGMTRGYLNRPDLTASAFVPDPFVPGEVMYRTGDLARWRADGQLTLLGRRDDQVNVRGVRMELGEIEAALRAHDAIADAVAVVDRHPVAGERLVAYVVGDRLPDTAAIRTFLGQRLPEHFIPAVVVPIGAVPRTGTGKVDRRRLPSPETVVAPPSRPPAGVTEEVVAEIFEEVLGVAPGADDDFFALGGQSILAAGVTARIRDRFEVALPVRALFEAPTVAGLAVHIEAAIIAELEAEELVEGIR